MPLTHNNSRLPQLRVVCSAATDKLFLVAAKRPFEEGSEEFNKLFFMSDSVHTLDEGSQVFVYDRRCFGGQPDFQEEGLMAHLSEIAAEVGSLAVYPNIRKVGCEE